MMINIIKRYLKIKKLQYVKLHYTNYWGYQKFRFINLDELIFIDCRVSYDKELMCYFPELLLKFKKERPFFDSWYQLPQHSSPDYAQAIDRAEFQKKQFNYSNGDITKQNIMYDKI